MQRHTARRRRDLRSVSLTSREGARSAPRRAPLVAGDGAGLVGSAFINGGVAVRRRHESRKRA